MVVDSRSRPGAADPFSTPDVDHIDCIEQPAYGPAGAYIETYDPRGRDIHGGGSSLIDPYAPLQGWKPTFGCTRGQNRDVQALGLRLANFKNKRPGIRIPYIRKD